jgi:ribosomal protein S18 acetylase RimI-like enzyme
MKETIVVRRLTDADVADYRSIRLSALKTAPEAFGAVYAVEAAKPMESHEERLTSSMVFGAYDRGRIVGLIGLRREQGVKDAHKGFVWGFYVEPWCRGMGVGEALIDAVLAAARGVVEQLTLTVVEENDGAIRLYKRFGFVRYGVEPRALKSEAGYSNEVLMVRFL